MDGIHEEIVAFCEKAGLPFATTPNGRGIVPETHPLSLGVLGLFGDGRAEEYLFGTPCDLLIAVGVSFDGLVTRSFSPRWSGLQVDVVHVDPDPSAFGRFVATSLGIPTSSRAFVESIRCPVGRRNLPRGPLCPAPVSSTAPETPGRAPIPSKSCATWTRCCRRIPRSARIREPAFIGLFKGFRCGGLARFFRPLILPPWDAASPGPLAWLWPDPKSGSSASPGTGLF